ncbi:interferon-inducible protein AIM2-like [Acipenser ruthenus]|uniref:interferon-inducible protein AIM2-like n=1 Tax=Acipenser ruthenus TaxID=7906 RepID=UPI0027407955|nr:interferon-inducible protein AIM2-like [Acipenser ruthenus]XP_058872941.1 interferon-inducible protein AIM2-like [Acipenser ruthenus]XP_058872942.1 interferon-inducible protein AIM2-like [Acipenser ruthenus]XP_058872943.1 interferon-inducible protein AIM2-like [Acipenser ruthenus]
MKKTLKDHLVDTLDDLVEEQFTRFKDKLGETRFQGRKIAKGKLQKAKSLEVASLLISTYSQTHAAKNAVSILRAINEADLAEELKKKTRAARPPKKVTKKEKTQRSSPMTVKNQRKKPAGTSNKLPPKKLKVMKISQPITYTNKKKETKEVVIITFADPKDITQAKLYDMAKIKKFKEGKFIDLQNYIIDKVDKRLVITKLTKVSPDAGFEISDKVLKKMLPVPLNKANSRRIKTPITIQGKVTEVNEKLVNGNEVTITDSTAETKLTLWGDLTRTRIKQGDWIEATNVTLNTYDQSYNTSWATTIEVKEVLEVTIKAFDKRGTKYILKTEKQSYTIQSTQLKSFLGCGRVTEILENLERKLPLKCCVVLIKGTDTVQIIVE